ncbi:MAG: hypothetical protein J6U54_12050 [Clostridiales bacterium]|nr:hypothetical protein [Clostridiales bacterium]
MNEKISPDEFVSQLKAIKKKWYNERIDEEVCHIEMDELLCKTLSSLGYDEGIKLFRTTPKWYA